MRKKAYVLAGFLLVAVLLLIPSMAFADASATRTLPATVVQGEQFTVDITTDLNNGAIEEYLPDGFVFAGTETVSAPCTMVAYYVESEHKIDFVYLGGLPDPCAPTDFSYDVIASDTLDTYTFDGTITDSEAGNNENPVGGDTDITVTTEPPVPEVVVNEFISDPETGNECIELANKTGSQVDLTDWTIEDATENPDALDGYFIPANGYLTLEQGTDFAFQLNNGGDTITLKYDGDMVDEVTYGNEAGEAPVPGDGQSAGRYPDGTDTDVDEDDFILFDTPTCGEVNTITIEDVTARRTLPGAVELGATLDVTLYCVGINPGGVTETLPDGFDYVAGSVTGDIAHETVDGNTVSFGWLQGGSPPTIPGSPNYPGTFTYSVTASDIAGEYSFSGLVEGTAVSSDTEASVDVAGDTDVRVRAATERILTMAVSGQGTTDPAEGDHYYDQGNVVDITATPAAGWAFDGWTGETDTVADVNDPTTTVTMDEDYEITANFIQAQYTLTTSVSGQGTVDPPEGDHNYDMGDVVDITATPAAGWYFDSWTGDTGTIDNVDHATTTITMNGSYDITANFTDVFDPYIYDTDQNGVISKQEALNAVVDYFDNEITKQEALLVIVEYFG